MKPETKSIQSSPKDRPFDLTRFSFYFGENLGGNEVNDSVIMSNVMLEGSFILCLVLFRSGAALMIQYYSKANIEFLSSHVCNLLGYYKEHARLLITEGCQLSAKREN